MGAPTYRTDEAIYHICDGAFTDDVSGELTEKVADEFPYDIVLDGRSRRRIARRPVLGVGGI